MSPNVLEQARLICPECSAEDIIKYGTRKGVQVYKCKPCDMKFTANGAMPGRRIPPEQVGAALSMFYSTPRKAPLKGDVWPKQTEPRKQGRRSSAEIPLNDSY